MNLEHGVALNGRCESSKHSEHSEFGNCESAVNSKHSEHSEFGTWCCFEWML